MYSSGVVARSRVLFARCSFQMFPSGVVHVVVYFSPVVRYLTLQEDDGEITYCSPRSLTITSVMSMTLLCALSALRFLVHMRAKAAEEERQRKVLEEAERIRRKADTEAAAKRDAEQRERVAREVLCAVRIGESW